MDDERHVVLIVDDTPENLRVLGSMLEHEGYEVLLATNGPDALANAGAIPPPDLVLLDIMMPDMDGYEVCRRMKADPAMQRIPVIFISALGMIDQKIQAFRQGAVDYITKPFHAEEVVARVRTHVQLARTEELTREIAQRKIAEKELHNLNARLEEQVAERTAHLKDANDYLEAFCSSISHDLRSPIANVSALCQLLSDNYADKFDSEGRELIDYIMSSAQKMSDRIQALLAFSRLNRAELTRVPVDLSRIAHDILKNFREAEPERNVELAIQDGIVEQADPNLICAVMENLLGNAWKYTGKTVVSYIEFGAEDSDGEKILVVRDNGAGFNMSEVDKLFVMFQRMHSEHEFAGDGIGLATVQRIINRHGGRIWADAEPGKGAVFRFTLG